jgi:hypothetical protein
MFGESSKIIAGLSTKVSPTWLEFIAPTSSSRALPMMGGGGEYSAAGGLRNDSREPNESGGSYPYAPLGYNNSYYSATSTISTCGVGEVVRSVRSNHVDLRLFFQLNGTSRRLLVPFETSTNYTYFFPANTGIWKVDNLSAPGGPGGGWAFSFTPCPP